MSFHSLSANNSFEICCSNNNEHLNSTSLLFVKNILQLLKRTQHSFLRKNIGFFLERRICYIVGGFGEWISIENNARTLKHKNEKPILP